MEDNRVLIKVLLPPDRSLVACSICGQVRLLTSSFIQEEVDGQGIQQLTELVSCSICGNPLEVYVLG